MLSFLSLNQWHLIREFKEINQNVFVKMSPAEFWIQMAIQYNTFLDNMLEFHQEETRIREENHYFNIFSARISIQITIGFAEMRGFGSKRICSRFIFLINAFFGALFRSIMNIFVIFLGAHCTASRLIFLIKTLSTMDITRYFISSSRNSI